jgi:transmembrane sensor
VGSWNVGVLHFQNATLAEVAEYLSRAVGKPVRAGAGVGGLRYTGTLAIDGPPDQVMARAEPLLGVAIRDDGKNWEMKLPDGASR